MSNTQQAHFFDFDTMTLTHENGGFSRVPKNTSTSLTNAEDVEEYLLSKQLILKGDCIIMLA